MQPGKGQLGKFYPVVKTCYFAVFHHHIVKTRMIVHRQGNEVFVVSVMTVQAKKIDRVINISIADKQRLIPQIFESCTQPSPGSKYYLLLLNDNPLNSRQSINNLIAQMMTVDHNMIKTKRLQPSYGKQKKRLIQDREKRFRTNQRVRQQPGT